MPTDVSRLLQRWQDGDRRARDELLPLVNAELRRIARSLMRRQRPGHTLQPTALVNEAFVKLFEGSEPHVAGRAHFLALMSRIMRQVLVDHARARGAAKRGGRDIQVRWDTRIEVPDDQVKQQVMLLDLDRALEALEREHRALAEVVEMHYFGGMTAVEAAMALGRSVHVVRHEIRLGRAWLRRKLSTE